MKKIVLVFTLLLLLSPACWSKWVPTAQNQEGNWYYLDDERIKKIGKYVYYWEMENLLMPNEWGDKSFVAYKEVDCKMFRFKVLKFLSYTQSMGEGIVVTNMNPPDEWHYPTPNSSVEHMSNIVCIYAN